jgi:hypothetical protein
MKKTFHATDFMVFNLSVLTIRYINIQKKYGL